MHCPKCMTDMTRIDFEGVEVDRCINCYGLWFDFQEQQQLKQAKDAGRVDTGDRAVGAQLNLVENIYCPRDGTRLTHMVDVEQPHISYEACPHCYGVFFDAGEFTDYSRNTLLESLRRLF